MQLKERGSPSTGLTLSGHEYPPGERKETTDLHTTANEEKVGDWLYVLRTLYVTVPGLSQEVHSLDLKQTRVSRQFSPLYSTCSSWLVFQVPKYVASSRS